MMIVATDSGALIGWGKRSHTQRCWCQIHINPSCRTVTRVTLSNINFPLTFLSLNMCLLPLPLVDTFFSDAGALYLVLLSRADRLWISCLDWGQDTTNRLSWRSSAIIVVQNTKPPEPHIVSTHSFKFFSKFTFSCTCLAYLSSRWKARVSFHQNTTFWW